METRSSQAALPDRPVFERLVEEHRALVRGVCLRVLENLHDVEDATQETFMRLWNALRRNVVIDNAGAWLRTAAASVAVDLLRRRLLRNDDARVWPISQPRIEPPTPFQHAAENELERDLRQALQRFPEGQRTIFELRHDAGMKLSEVAALLQISVTTAKTQFARACLRLQPILRKHRASPENEP